MGDFNDGKVPVPCLRLDTGCGANYESVELGDGTGYIRLDLVEKWRDLVWKLYAALGYARQFGEFSVVDGAVVEGILIGCSGIIEELPQLQEIRFGQMQSAADMLEQARVSGEMQATMDKIRKLEREIEMQSLQGGIQRGCPWCEAEREEAQDGGK